MPRRGAHTLASPACCCALLCHESVCAAASVCGGCCSVCAAVLLQVCLFLYGLDLLTDSMKLVLGDRFKLWLARLTSNRFVAIVLGCVMTVACQSSGITTVLIIGLVSAELMEFKASIGVILGANVGSTITGQIISFSITKYFPGLLFFGLLLQAIPVAPTRARNWMLVGSSLLGLGLIFAGMETMSTGAKILKTIPEFTDALQRMSNRVVAVIVGIVVTGIIQSSGAMSAIVITLANQGLLSIEMGMAIMVGANIGSCVPAMMAAMKQNRVAQQAALAHLCFNILLVLVWTPALPLMVDFVKLFPPHVDENVEGWDVKRETEVPRQIANAHTFMNLSIMFLLLPITPQYARFIQWLRPLSPSKAVASSSLLMLDHEDALWKGSSTTEGATAPAAGTAAATDGGSSVAVSVHDPSGVALPDLHPVFINSSYLSGVSVELGWHVLAKETLRFTQRLTYAFQLVTQALMHTYMHAQMEAMERRAMIQANQSRRASREGGALTEAPALMTAPTTAADGLSSEGTSPWTSVFSSHAGRQLTEFTVWSAGLWPYHASLRSFHSSLVSVFGLITTQQAAQLIRWSSMLQALETAVQTLHQLIATAHFIQTQEPAPTAATPMSAEMAATGTSDALVPRAAAPAPAVAPVLPPSLYELIRLVGRVWEQVGEIIRRVVEADQVRHQSRSRTGSSADKKVAPADADMKADEGKQAEADTFDPVATAIAAEAGLEAIELTSVPPTAQLVKGPSLRKDDLALGTGNPVTLIVSASAEVSALVRETIATVAAQSGAPSQPLAPGVAPPFSFPVRMAKSLKALYFSAWQIAQLQAAADAGRDRDGQMDEEEKEREPQEMQWMPATAPAPAPAIAAAASAVPAPAAVPSPAPSPAPVPAPALVIASFADSAITALSPSPFPDASAVASPSIPAAAATPSPAPAPASPTPAPAPSADAASVASPAPVASSSPASEAAPVLVPVPSPSASVVAPVEPSVSPVAPVLPTSEGSAAPVPLVEVSVALVPPVNEAVAAPVPPAPISADAAAAISSGSEGPEIPAAVIFHIDSEPQA